MACDNFWASFFLSVMAFTDAATFFRTLAFFTFFSTFLIALTFFLAFLIAWMSPLFGWDSRVWMCLISFVLIFNLTPWSLANVLSFLSAPYPFAYFLTSDLRFLCSFSLLSSIILFNSFYFATESLETFPPLIFIKNFIATAALEFKALVLLWKAAATAFAWAIYFLILSAWSLVYSMAFYLTSFIRFLAAACSLAASKAYLTASVFSLNSLAFSIAAYLVAAALISFNFSASSCMLFFFIALSLAVVLWAFATLSY